MRSEQRVKFHGWRARAIYETWGFWRRWNEETLMSRRLGICFEWRKIVILSDDARLAKWVGQHVTIFGHLDRFGGAMRSSLIG
jgi:hypothetical protein